MNRTIKIVSVVLILLFAGTVVLSVTTHFWIGKKKNEQRNQKSVSNWQTFQNDKFDFAFQYPPKAIVDISDPAIAGEPKRVRVRLIGPKSEPNTEITDGFTFYVRSTSLKEQETLDEAVNRILKAETERRKIIDELTYSEINNRKAYIFSVRSELGSEVTYSILEGEGNTFFITTSMINIPNGVNRSYTEMIQRMQESLRKQD